jgi:galactokinase
VSSSAAIEVATMAALAAAYHVVLEPMELAVLCQKVCALSSCECTGAGAAGRGHSLEGRQ